ncbi:VOC family protein [Granulicella sibirica]|uniref:Glyoxalase/fosfomycin resistance/dioxygenase domain-containing protein n=1 Tax=Granulicella sibirica TaxID=2479048 RepID=A0A4Q0T8D5_9BACT|nr:VOC family protein [Granulicella sibirica]RXH58299.1 hypothetical protein GRAN_1609 [Granulicella sibirica]
MEITVHLGFPGTCETAFRFYERCLGGTITTLLTWGESPIAGMVGEDWRGKVCHATLDLGGSLVMGVDTPPLEYERIGGFQMLLKVESVGRAEEVFAALGQGGTVKMALAETFWAERYGIVVDQFGVTWEVQAQVTQNAA